MNRSSHYIKFAALSLLLCSLQVIASQHTRGTSPLALDNVRIIDADRGAISAARCVRIEDGHIVRISRAGSRRCIRNATVYDLDKRYLLPGLIDMHAHLTLGPMEFRRQRGRTEMVALADDEITEHNARRLVAFGITTIRNPGGDLAAAARYKSRLEAGELIGPESFDAGPVINDADIPGLAKGVRTEDEIRAVVAAQVEAGADWIKLYTGLSPALLQAGIDAAHAHDRPAVAHLADISWPDALAMGLDGLVHLMPISPDLLDPAQLKAWQAGARPGTFAFFEWWEQFDPDGPAADKLVDAFDRYRPVFDATLVAFHAAFVQDQDNSYKADSRQYAHPRLLALWEDWFTFAIGWDPDDFVRARAIWPKVQRMAYRLYTSDARMTLGTDMSNPWIAPGISLHREMELLTDAGVPNTHILAAATVNAAGALGAGQRLGRIEPGFEADLLVLDHDPLVDIAHTREIHAVVLDGHYISTHAITELKGE